MEPEVEYEFRVVAHNSAGFGQPSNPSAIVQLRPMLTGTDPNAIRRPRDPHDRGVPYPPGRPQVVGMDGTTATLTWEPPIDTGSGGPLIGYSVEYRPPGTDWITANNYPIRDNSYTGETLSPIIRGI